MAAASAARSTCARSRRKSRACRRARSGATRRRSATSSPLRRRASRSSARSASASAARSPSSAPRTREGRLIVRDPRFDNDPVDVPLDVILGKPPKMTRDVSHVRRSLPPNALANLDLREAAYRVLQLPAVADKTFLVTIGDRTVGGPVRARSDGRAVAGSGGRRRRHVDGLQRVCRRGDGDRRAHAARVDRRRCVGSHRGSRSVDEPRGRARGVARRREAVGELDGERRSSGRGCDVVRHRASGSRLLHRAVGRDSGRQGFDVDAHDAGATQEASTRSPRRCR